MASANRTTPDKSEGGRWAEIDKLCSWLHPNGHLAAIYAREFGMDALAFQGIYTAFFRAGTPEAGPILHFKDGATVVWFAVTPTSVQYMAE